MPRRSRTFVSVTGPPDNIGDAVLRRGALDWVRNTSEELIVYTGNAPDIWLRQIDSPSRAIVLRSKRSVPKWLWMLCTAPSRPVLVFEPGEVPLDRGNTLRELVFLAETLIVRLKRGIVVRPPRSIRAPNRSTLRLHALAARCSQFALWRDGRSAETIRCGRVVPDLGFAAGAELGSTPAERDELIVSLRGTRPYPPAEWIAAVRGFAAAETLRIRTVVQVREDETRSQALAEDLGGVFEPWNGTDAVAQEALLRARYARARLVLSDRMHVLVLAALSGAIPVELVPHPTPKIAASFATVGLHAMSADAATTSSEGMQEFLRRQSTRTDEVARCVHAAERGLDEMADEVRAFIRASRG